MKLRIPTGANLEIFRFAVYITSPILLMLWVGHNTYDKLNVSDFWPDPARLNRIPRDRAELKEELARIHAAQAEKQRLKNEASQSDLAASK